MPKVNDKKLCIFWLGCFFVVLRKDKFHLGLPVCSVKMISPAQLWLGLHLTRLKRLSHIAREPLYKKYNIFL